MVACFARSTATYNGFVGVWPFSKQKKKNVRFVCFPRHLYSICFISIFVLWESMVAVEVRVIDSGSQAIWQPDPPLDMSVNDRAVHGIDACNPAE